MIKESDVAKSRRRILEVKSDATESRRRIFEARSDNLQARRPFLDARTDVPQARRPFLDAKYQHIVHCVDVRDVRMDLTHARRLLQPDALDERVANIIIKD